MEDDEKYEFLGKLRQTDRTDNTKNNKERKTKGKA